MKPEVERGLLTRAQEQDELSKLANVSSAAEIERGKLVDIPLLRLGVINPLRRAHICDDLD